MHVYFFAIIQNLWEKMGAAKLNIKKLNFYSIDLGTNPFIHR